MDKGKKGLVKKKDKYKKKNYYSSSSHQPECVPYMNEDARDGRKWR